MSLRKAYRIIYDKEVTAHLQSIDRKYYGLIKKEIRSQLLYEPEKETRNRKPLSQPSGFGTAWELRFGPENKFRVFYRTGRRLKAVYVLAIGIKIRERLYIGREEFQL